MEAISRRNMLSTVAAIAVAPWQLKTGSEQRKPKVVDVHYYIVSRLPEGKFDWEVCYRVADDPWRIERSKGTGATFKLLPSNATIDVDEKCGVSFTEEHTDGRGDIFGRIGNVTADYLRS